MPDIQMPSILLVDDERIFVKGLQRSLEQEGYLVEQCKGTIKLTSRPGEGSTFTVRVPGFKGKDQLS